MSIDSILDWLSDRETVPNKFTIAMGKLIRQAREEANLSQTELAKKVYRRQATISDIESGKTRTDSETLLLLAHHLNKPLYYFFPKELSQLPESSELSTLQVELLAQASQLSEDDLERLIATARAFLDTKRSREKKTE